MNRKVLGIAACVGLLGVVFTFAGQRGEAFAQRAGTVATDSELIVIPTALGEKSQMLTVVDPRQRVMSVYHIDLASGKIALKSVRNIQWDLQMLYLNNENPLPQEIRSLLEQR